MTFLKISTAILSIAICLFTLKPRSTEAYPYLGKRRTFSTSYKIENGGSCFIRHTEKVKAFMVSSIVLQFIIFFLAEMNILCKSNTISLICPTKTLVVN